MYKNSWVDFDMRDFRSMDLIVEGESKEIREDPNDSDKVIIWLKPTVYSFTENRCGILEGSNLARARAMKTLIPLLKSAGIDHAYEEICDQTGFILARKIKPEEDPNVEVIVKCYNSGTSYHRYYGLDKKPTRASHPFWPGDTFTKDECLNGPKIRFDWRNPFFNPEKRAFFKSEYGLPSDIYQWPAEIRSRVMMRDEVMGEDFANEVIDVKNARRTALHAYSVLQQHMARCNIIIYDLCFFLTTDGKTMYGEVNQDCGRFRHLDHGMLDKDLWRAGLPPEKVLEKWRLMADMIENPVR